MKRARGWIVAAAVSAAIAAAAYALQPHQDSPEHSSSSDAPNGTSAALLYAQAMGHPAGQITGTFDPTAAGYGLVLVFTPTSPFTADEARRTVDWVSSGGILVYASELGDGELDRALGVNRAGNVVSGATETGTPVVSGVRQVAGGDGVIPLDLGPRQVALLHTVGGGGGAYLERIGEGIAVVLADPLVLCNGYLERADNGALLADLLALAGPGSSIGFDEYHHGLTLSDVSPQQWLTTPWGAALLWLLVAVFFGLVLRGRRFGPLVERASEGPRSDVEWAVAVGHLLRRSSARNVTLGLIANATERAVAAQTGLAVQPRDRFWQALWVRAPHVAAELAEIETSLPELSATETDLMHAAARLHAIAHPLAPSPTRPGRR